MSQDKATNSQNQSSAIKIKTFNAKERGSSELRPRIEKEISGPAKDDKKVEGDFN
jgi:hypothetical protein